MSQDLHTRLGLQDSVRTRRLGLHLPDHLAFSSWKEVGEQLSIVTDSSAWWLGDWLVYGESHFADRYRTAVAATTLDYQTLRNYAWVARRFPMSRRRDTLSFQHHAEVAALAGEDQDLWLDRAMQHDWSKSRLRRELRAARSGTAAIPRRAASVLTVTLPPDQEQRWQEAAERAHRSLEDWVKIVLDAAAEEMINRDGLVSDPETVLRLPTAAEDHAESA